MSMQAWTGEILMGIIGGASGVLVAGGVVALMVGLGIIRRFIGISHTAGHAKLYETFICLGGLFGCILTVYFPRILLGNVGLAVSGLFCGIFVGGWIMALAELLSIFPVFARRLGLVKGKSWIILALAAGKIGGSLLGFYMGWGKK